MAPKGKRTKITGGIKYDPLIDTTWSKNMPLHLFDTKEQVTSKAIESSSMAPDVIKPEVNVNISQAAKERDRSSTQLTNARDAHDYIYQPVLDLMKENQGMSLRDAVKQIKPGKADNTISNIINRNFDRNTENLKNLLSEKEFKNYENTINQFKKERELYQAESQIVPKSLKREIHTHTSGKGIQQRDKYKKFFGEDVLQGEHTMMLADKYQLVELGKKDTAVKFRQPEYATTKTRNQTIKNEIARTIKRQLVKKDEIIQEIQEAVRTKQSNYLPILKEQLKKIEDVIKKQSKDAEKLGLKLAIVNKNTGKITYHGKQYNSMVELYKSFKDLKYNKGGYVQSSLASIDEVLNGI